MAKDYYKILGIEKSASPETIKRAYRDAVKKLHPDLNRGPFDKKQFCDIQEAYEAIIKGAEKMTSFNTSQTTGVSVYRQESPPETLYKYRDTGAFTGNPGPCFFTAPGQTHTVEVLLNRKEVQRGGILTLHVPVITPCEFCGGTGRTGFFACLMCGGSGETAWQIPVSFSIPPGVTRGTMLKIPFETKHGKTHLLKVLIDVELFW